jgi:hypothetical protein
MCKIEIEHKEETQFPCFGIDKFSDGIVVVELTSESKGTVVIDSRLNPVYATGEYSEDWAFLIDWGIVTKEFTLKFSL